MATSAGGFCRGCCHPARKLVSSIVVACLLLLLPLADALFPGSNFLSKAVQLVQTAGVTDPTLNCTDEQLLSLDVDRLAFAAAARSANGSTLIVSVALAQQGDPTGVLLTAAGLQVEVAKAAGDGGWALSLSALDNRANTATFALTALNPRLALSFRGAQSIRLCIDCECPPPLSVTGFSRAAAADEAGDSWLSSASGIGNLGAADILLGSKSGDAASCTVNGLWVVAGSGSVDAVLAAASADAAGDGPSISMERSSQADLVVNQASQFVFTAAAGLPGRTGLTLRVTLFGAAPAPGACTSSSCGDVVQLFQGGTIAQGVVAATYPRAGRYVLRAQASDSAGGWTSRDFAVIVRKAGDSAGRAPCCRSTGLVIAQQLGRPISSTEFRPPWINSTAAAVGWAPDYLTSALDLEAERLFDFGVLAPVETGPLRTLSCADVFAAGFGSPTTAVTPDGVINAASNLGSNKRWAVVPQGFSWAPSAARWDQQLPTCVTHWSSWVGSSPWGQAYAGSKLAYCSYTCTPEGVRQLVTTTGTMDRWQEALIESSYGRLSLLPDPIILPTLDMPRGAAPGQNAFSYSEGPVLGHLQSLGHEMSDIHTIVVLSPLPQFVNPGFTAWANAGGSPLLFVMRCNPQHYYLFHEMGHRLGMPHATVYRIQSNQSSSSQAPTSPFAAGVIEDTYTDKLDIMACCKGDFSLWNRIMAGWVPAAERVTLGLAEMAGGWAVTRRFTLWPFDRSESKGRIKGVVLRLEDGKILALGYRSTAFWQDVRLGRDKSDKSARPLAPDHSRHNVAGLSVEYIQRYLDASGRSTWSIRGLLDFNMAFVRYPSALPASAGSYPADPPGAAFTLLREGDAWLDEDHNLLVAVERIVACEQPPLVPVYSYGVWGFYGFRGEKPGEEEPRRQDYTGYEAGLKCLQLRVVTGVTASPGSLNVKVRMQGLDERNRLILGGDQCGFPVRPRLQLLLPGGVDVMTIVWRDNLNRTVALDAAEVELPPLASLAEASVADAKQCNQGCSYEYHVKVVAVDGAQTAADISIGSVSLASLTMMVRYSYYVSPSSIVTAFEHHAIPVVQRPVQRSAASQGRPLLIDPLPLQAEKVFGSRFLPDSSCSNQWSVSINLDIPSSVLAPPGDGARLLHILTALTAEAADASSPGWPHVLLKVSSAGTALVAVWGDGGSREIGVALTPSSSGMTSLHVAVVRDGTRLGVWANSQGGWVLEDVWCIPDRAVTFCSRRRAEPLPDSAFRALRLGRSSVDGGVIARSLRVYSFALPRLSLMAESACADDFSCGRFLVIGSTLPPEPQPGSITLQGAVPLAASKPLSLKSSTHFLLVGEWSPCSAVCGGGWRTRGVRCMKIGPSPGSVSQVPLDDCPLTEEIPASSQRCNTVACPAHSLQLLADRHSLSALNSSCGRCRILGTAADAARLVCINSLGLPQPLSLCCEKCSNSSVAWEDIPVTASLGRAGDSALNLLDGSGGGSLRALVMDGGLSTACQAPACGRSAVSWQLGDWSACSSNCGGGRRTRAVTCTDSSGAAVPPRQCQKALGQLPAELLWQQCNSRPCGLLYAWQVGAWSSCSGDEAFGHASRSLTCIDSSGATPGGGNRVQCKALQPAASAVCAKQAAAAECRPSFVLESLFGSLECFGHGLCSMTGCACRDGWAGQFCEVAPACAATGGVMDEHNWCCQGGVLDIEGKCCSTGAVLDASGLCCAAGRVDVCGKCGGTAWTTDIQGTCCSSLLDAAGVCCQSGSLDECGVCDGDSSSCAARLRLLVSLPNSNALPDTATLADLKATLQRMVLQQFSQLTVQSVAPRWALQPPPARRLLLEEEHSHSCINLGLASPSTCMAPSTINRQAARRLQAAAAVTWRAAEVDVVLAQQGGLSLTTQASALSLAGLGSALTAQLEGQAGTVTTAAADGSSGLQLRLSRVLLVERVGVCGNGICEVGERLVTNSEGAALHAGTSCSQDCPFGFQMCAAPTGAVGDLSRECGGNGRCLRTQGVCDCFIGYAGDACEMCAASFYPSRRGRSCVSQWILGRNVFQANAQDLDKTLAGTVFLVIGTVFAATVLSSLLWVLWRWLVLGQPPKALHKLLRRQPSKPPPGSGVTKKYLLDEVELSTPPTRAALRHRSTFTAADGTAAGDDELLKAIRGFDLAPREPDLPMLFRDKRQLSGSMGRSAPGSTGASAQPQEGGLLIKTLSEAFSRVQHGLSEAGSSVARTVSGGVSRLSSNRGSGYQVLVTDDAGDVLEPQLQQQGTQRPSLSPLGNSTAAGSPRSSVLLAAPAAAATSLRSSSRVISDGAAVPGGALLVPAGLARIKTRRLRDNSSAGVAAAGMQQQPPSTGTTASGRPGWRTRAEYQDALLSDIEPLLQPHELSAARGWHSPSDPGQRSDRVRAQAGLGGAAAFVATPLAGHSDLTNRDLLEAFGGRMQRWFSPQSEPGGDSSGSSSGGLGTWSRGTSSLGGLTGFGRAAATTAAGAAGSSSQPGAPFGDLYVPLERLPTHDEQHLSTSGTQPQLQQGVQIQPLPAGQQQAEKGQTNGKQP